MIDKIFEKIKPRVLDYEETRNLAKQVRDNPFFEGRFEYYTKNDIVNAVYLTIENEQKKIHKK